MSHLGHLTMQERERILILRVQGKGPTAIGKAIGRCKSVISRELVRNRVNESNSAVSAQKRYQRCREKSKRPKLLENLEIKETVLRLILMQQWTPEQISNRLAHENSAFSISYNTIYRAIYAGMLDTKKRSRNGRGAEKMLRHRGKTRRKKGTVETRGKIVISNPIEARPQEAAQRKAIGHWEADTMAGKMGSACLVTITDRASRFLLAAKVVKKLAGLVNDKMIALLGSLPKHKRRSITPDRGKEFAKHSLVTSALDGLPFYFPDPHAPWQRGTNENTNGLLREYLPKRQDMAPLSDDEVLAFVDKIYHRPRKCLGWKSPQEVFFGLSLHLI